MKVVGCLAVLFLLLILLIFGMSPSRSSTRWNECQSQAYERWNACLYNCEQYPDDSDDRIWCVHSCILTLNDESYTCEAR